jgi:hypothetical protein
MSIAETCSCGAKFKTDEPNAIVLVREWRRKHVCQEAAPESRDIETTSIIGFSPDYQGTGLDLAAKKYDPWKDDEE